MNVLSVDVGMRCLAICLFEVAAPGEFVIKKWEVLDLTGEGSRTCAHCDETGKSCTAGAKYRKHGTPYCRVHAKRQALPLPPRDLLRVGPKSRVSDIRALAEKYGVVFPKGARKSECVRCLQGFLQGKYMEALPKVDTRNIDLVTYGRRLKTQLGLLLSGVRLDKVVIENQIGPRAIRMKVLQGMITQHFIEAGCEHIVKVSPANKLKPFLGENEKTSYGERKKIAVRETAKKISEQEHSAWLDHFATHKKKDDLADAFLQGIWYLNNLMI